MMARHIMAVCVVCLLCADHLPCQQHVETLFPNNLAAISPGEHHINAGGGGGGSWEHTPLNAIVYKSKDISATSSYSAKTQQKRTTDAASSLSSPIADVTTTNRGDNRNRRRKKRHADHGHGGSSSSENSRPEITNTFLRRIFSEYGSGDTINVDDFQRMLEKLGLHQLLPQKLLHHHEDNENETVSSILPIVYTRDALPTHNGLFGQKSHQKS